MAARLLYSGLFVAFATISFAAEPSSRIVGGNDAPTYSYPFVASVRLDNLHNCGGSIISDQHVITAAHCLLEGSKVVDPQRVSVRVGSTNQFAGGSLVRVTKTTLHPDYVDLKNDLAILTLAQKLTFTERISSIKYADEIPPVDAEVTTAGWGEEQNGESPFKLQHTTLKVASADVCADAFSDYDESVICLDHEPKHGTCRGDGGNGAVFDRTLVAVSNFVIGACGARYPDVYCNIANFSDWITSVIEADSTVPQ